MNLTRSAPIYQANVNRMADQPAEETARAAILRALRRPGGWPPEPERSGGARTPSRMYSRDREALGAVLLARQRVGFRHALDVCSFGSRRAISFWNAKAGSSVAERCRYVAQAPRKWILAHIV